MTTTARYELAEPPWVAPPFNGDSDKWGDEQDRSEWFEGEAERLAGVAADYAAEAFARQAAMKAAWSALDRSDIPAAYEALGAVADGTT
jgi:hypothetical protein